MAANLPGLTSSQRGKIAEYFAAMALMAASGGRLSPFVPLADDHGLDLIVLDKKTGRSLSLQVKSWVGGPSKRKQAQFDIRKATFHPLAGGAVLAVVIDPVTLGMEVAWLFPMLEIRRIAIEQPEKYALVPSRELSSQDRYSNYRYSDVTSLTAAVDILMARADGGGESVEGPIS